MNISINETEIQDAISLVTKKAVTDGLGGYEVQRIIRESAVDAVLASALVDAVKASVQKADFVSMTDAISKELVRTVASVVTESVREAAVTIILGFNKQPYMSDKERTEAREKILARMKL